MYAIYRHVKAKRAAAAAAEAQKPLSSPDLSTAPNTTSNGQDDATIDAGLVEAEPQSSLKWKITLAIALVIPVLLETLDYTVVATAQPQIASVFHRLDLQSYIGTLYLLTSTVFLPLFASVADIFGRHAALQVSLAFFIFGSALSTGANSMPMMLGGRAVAGIGAAGLMTVVRIILADSSSLDDNNWQVSIMFFLYAVGYSIGPVIGGSLIQVSYRWVFAINLPCCAISMVLGFFLLRNKVKGGQSSSNLPGSSSEKETYLTKLLRIDWVGATFFVIAGILLLLALNWGSNESWNSAKVIASFVVGALAMVACIAYQYLLERTRESPNPSKWRILWTDPLLPLEVFRNYDVCAVQYASFVGGMVMLVMFYFVAIFMIIVTGLSPNKAGVQLIYFAPGMGGGSLISIRIIKWTRQPRYAIIPGLILTTVALGLVSMAMAQQKQSLVNGFMALTGVGVGMSVGPLAIQARFSLGSERVAIVAALTLFFRSFGGTVGLAQCAAVLNAKVKSYIAHLIATGAISPSDVAALANASPQGGFSSIQDINSLSPALQHHVKDAFRVGTQYAFISLIPWCGIAVFLCLFLSKIPDSDQQREEAKRKNISNETKDGVELGPINSSRV